MSDQTPVTPAPVKRSWFARHKILSTILALFVLGGIVNAANGGSNSNPKPVADTATQVKVDNSKASTPTRKAKPRPVHHSADGTFSITVTSTGSGVGAVTYMTPSADSMNMSQDTSASLPWHKAWTGVTDLFPGWNMNAQQHGGGTITCVIKKDGKVIAKNSSTGAYAMVTCAPAS